MTASSVYLGKIPGSLGSRDLVDWIPVDIAAQIIVDLAWESENKSRRDTGQNGVSIQDLSKHDRNDLQNQTGQKEDLAVSDPDSKDDLSRTPSNATSAAVYNIVNPSTTT